MSQPILLVDDDPTIVELVADVLRMAGYDVVSVNNGADALHIAQNDRQIGLVLSDIVMPGMSGIQLCETEGFATRTEVHPDVRLQHGYDGPRLGRAFFTEAFLSAGSGGKGKRSARVARVLAR